MKRVREEIRQNLNRPIRIGEDAKRRFRQIHMQRNVFLLEKRRHSFENALHGNCQIQRANLQRIRACLHAAQFL